MDTIFALSTAPGRGAIAIVRVSGSNAGEILAAFCGKIPRPRFATLASIASPITGEVIDKGVIVFFEKDHSYTGEAMAEFQVHGGIAVVNLLVSALSDSKLCRLAERGEFTRRALENERLDLLQAEGVGDLIAADTRDQLRMSNKLISGSLSLRVKEWREDLVYAAALVEATLDFADEEVPQDVGPEVELRLARVKRNLESELSGFGVNQRLREGFEVAIVGPPNAGKSSLLNVLAGREAAITSDVKGTTRDVIEVSVDLDGLPVTFLDTAGLRNTDDAVEAIGIERTRQRASSADVRVYLCSDDKDISFELFDGDIVVNSKADLSRDQERLNISTVSLEGIEELLARIASVLQGRFSGSSLISRERHRLAIKESLDGVELSLLLLKKADCSAEILSEVIKDATRSLELLIGKVGVEDLLGKIFSSFCIGK